MVEQRTRTTGSVSAGGGGGSKRGLAWLLALLALAIIAAGVIFLVARNAGDEGDDGGNLDTTNEESSSGENGDDPSTDERGGDGSGTAVDDGGEPTTGSGGSEGVAGGSGQLSSEGAALLPIPAGGLAAYADKPVEARSVQVQSVVADEGFWVGPSETERVFVFFAAENAGTESPVQVEAGRPVSFTGTVKALPATFESSFEIDAPEGAAQLAQQGYFVEVPPNAIRQG